MWELNWPNIPIVSAIIERINNLWEKEILIQTRWKPWVSEYSGSIEIQAWWIERYENVYNALVREIKEETWLNVLKIKPDIKSHTYNVSNDWAFAFKSFCCQQQIKWWLPWIWFVFICEVEKWGIAKNQESENKDLRWINIKHLADLVFYNHEKLFTLQIWVLQLYLEENWYYKILKK